MVDLNLVQEWFPIYLFLIGLLFGSFANVVIFRLPQGRSVVTPRSACGSCGTPVAWFDNIPVLSWLVLRGKCRKCSAKISFRYPLVEILKAVLFWAVGYKYGLSWTTLELLILTFGLVTVSFIDIDHMILPDSFTLSGIVIGLVGATLSPERDFLPSLYGVLVGGGFLWAVAYFYFALRNQDGMGGGDIKLLGWLGAVLSWTSVPFIILTSSVIGSIAGVSMALFRRSDMKSSIPFGPYLALGAFLYIFAGEEITNWYIDLFIPNR